MYLLLAIPLKSELAYEILEKGRVRFWMEATNLSAESSYRFVVNDLEIKDSEVCIFHLCFRFLCSVIKQDPLLYTYSATS